MIKQISKDPDKVSEEDLLIAAEQGHAESLYQLSRRYRDKDDERAFNYCKRAAEIGHYKAMDRLGFMYCKGIGTEHDHDADQYWWRQVFQIDHKLAIQGDVKSQEAVGFKYGEGVGCERSFEKAAYWLTRAHKNGAEDLEIHIDHFKRML